MKKIKNFNKVTGIKINKLLIIAFFIIAGCMISLLSSNKNRTDLKSTASSVTICINDNSIEPIVSLKEKKCSYSSNMQVDRTVSQSITRIYKNLKITFTKMINT